MVAIAAFGGSGAASTWTAKKLTRCLVIYNSDEVSGALFFAYGPVVRPDPDLTPHNALLVEGKQDSLFEGDVVFMNRLARTFSQFGPSKYLRIVVVSIAILTLANLLFSAMVFELGYRYESILYGPNDRFADLIKPALSYTQFLPHIEETKRFQSWPDIFKSYYFSNSNGDPLRSYGGKDALAQGHLTHFHAPPLTALVNIACAVIIGHTQSASLLIVLFFIVYLVVVQCTVLVCIPNEQRNRATLLVFWILCLLSYPALFVFSRAHFVDGIASLLIVMFLTSLFGRGRADAVAITLFAIALNIRPDAIIFIFAIPVVLGLRRSIEPILCCAALSVGILATSYFTVHALCPDYTVSTFFQGLKIYNKLYIGENRGDAFNSSLLAFIKTVNKISDMTNVGHRKYLAPFLGGLFASLALIVYWGSRRASRWIVAGPLSFAILYCMLVLYYDYHRHVYSVFWILSATLIAAVCWSMWRSPDRIMICPFYLTVLFCLVKPVLGDYNLLVFVAPVLLLFISSQEWTGRYHLVSVISLGSILMLSPKNYYLSNSGISTQLVLNPMILFVLTLYLVEESVAMHKEFPHESIG